MPIPSHLTNLTNACILASTGMLAHLSYNIHKQIKEQEKLVEKFEEAEKKIRDQIR